VVTKSESMRCSAGYLKVTNGTTDEAGLRLC
jgi:hypothetical protein